MDTDILSSNNILTPNASKPLDKLGTFLAFVCDYLQCGPKFLVVVSKPLQEWHALNQLMFLPCLRIGYNMRSMSLWATTEKSEWIVVLTSLSVKWDLSFSCSGVKYKIFSSIITRCWALNHFIGSLFRNSSRGICRFFTILSSVAFCSMHT